MKNRELRENFTDLDIVAVIKSKRLRWLGHVLKRNNAKNQNQNSNQNSFIVI